MVSPELKKLESNGCYLMYLNPADREKLLQILRDAHAKYYDSEAADDRRKMNAAKRFIRELEESSSNSGGDNGE